MAVKKQSELDKLEGIVSEFTKSAKELILSDHAKLDQMYEFFFIGKPEASPPIPPFIVVMQKNTDDISGFKRTFYKFSWILITILLTGLGTLIVAVYNHIFLVSK